MNQLDQCRQVARRAQQKTERERRGDGGEDTRGRGRNRRRDKRIKLGMVNTIHHRFASTLRQNLLLLNADLQVLTLILFLFGLYSTPLFLLTPFFSRCLSVMLFPRVFSLMFTDLSLFLFYSSLFDLLVCVFRTVLTVTSNNYKSDLYLRA